MSYSRRDLLRDATGAFAALALPRSLLEWRHADATTAPVDVAHKAAAWIRTAHQRTDAGITWPADPLKPDAIDRTFYNGTPGVVLFHLELAHATGDKRALAEAAQGADDLAAFIPRYDNAGLYTGLAGTAYVLAETRRATGDGKYRDAARRALTRIHELAQPTGKGVEWQGDVSNDVISGAAGIGLFLLWAEQHLEDRDAVALATKGAQRLVENAQPEHGGLKWGISPTVATLYPNFSHGTAGVSYFLATLYERTHDQAFLDAALAGVRYLDAVAVGPPTSYKIFHHEPDGTDLFYLSWCHGPVGTARLFHRLWLSTHDRLWLDRVHECARAIIDAGVPEQRSPGYWNNISQCCGDSGVGEFFLDLQRVAPRAEYKSIVERVEARLLSHATADGDGLKWIQAEHRVRPELLIAQTGFMQGASGVGTFFLHADGVRRGRRPFLRMPDTPFV